MDKSSPLLVTPRRASRLLILGNGWVVRTGYQPAAAALGIDFVEVVDFPIGTDVETAVTSARTSLLPSHWDIVVIATPNASHWPLVVAALETKAIILCEKPMMLPTEAALFSSETRLTERLFVSTPNRFREDVIRLLDICNSGGVGEILAVHVEWLRKFGVPRPGSWYTNRALSGGGALVDLGPHLLDIALLATGWSSTACKCARLERLVSDDLKKAAVWMASSRAAPASCDVERSATASFVTKAPKVEITIAVGWADDVNCDRTQIKVKGTRGTLILNTLFGFAPGLNTSELLLKGDFFRSEYFELRRDPVEDFARLISATIVGQGCAAAEGLKVMRAIAQAYAVSELEPLPE